jgi:hypothetical protein
MPTAAGDRDDFERLRSQLMEFDDGFVGNSCGQHRANRPVKNTTTRFRARTMSQPV